MSAIAVLLLPALCGATDTYYVKRNGCFYRVAAPVYHAPAVAVSKSAAEIGAGLLLKAEEFKFLRETAARAFGTPGGASYASSASEYAAQHGNTIYGANSGYSLQSFATVTPQPLDVAALMERATRLATQAQDHGATATAQAQGLLGQAQAGQQAIAQTFAQAARELSVLEALKPIAPQEVKTENSYTATATASTDAQTAGATAGRRPQAVDASSASAQAFPDWQPQLAAVISTRCATCHDAESPAGGLNLAGDVAAIDRSRWMAMLTRVTTGDVSQRMPKDAEPLSDAELLLFVKALGRGE
jgi:hypothetical protein